MTPTHLLFDSEQRVWCRLPDDQGYRAISLAVWDDAFLSYSHADFYPIIVDAFAAAETITHLPAEISWRFPLGREVIIKAAAPADKNQPVFNEKDDFRLPTFFFKSKSGSAKLGYVNLDAAVNYHTIELEDVRIVNPRGESILDGIALDVGANGIIHKRGDFPTTGNFNDARRWKVFDGSFAFAETFRLRKPGEIYPNEDTVFSMESNIGDVDPVEAHLKDYLNVKYAEEIMNIHFDGPGTLYDRGLAVSMGKSCVVRVENTTPNDSHYIKVGISGIGEAIFKVSLMTK